MSPSKRPVPRSTIERTAARSAVEIRVRLGAELRAAREDAGISLTRLATVAGLSKGQLHAIEAGRTQPRWETVARLCAVLGRRPSIVLYPHSDPLIRDHLQSSMVEALLAIAHPRWHRRLEVAVHRPVRGVIDLVLDDPAEPVCVACEAQSDLRRLEQQLRWSKAKADGLADSGGDGSGAMATVSRLLLLRSTAKTRSVVAQYSSLVATAHPARTADAYAALTGVAPWPGDALLWCRVERGSATILERPPRGISAGR